MNSESSLWYLENVDLQDVFCPNKMAMRESDHPGPSIKKSQYIYLQNDEADKIYFISEGRVKIGMHDANGKEITKAILSAGEVFGELSVIGEHKRRDYAIALEDTMLCAIPTKEMANLVRDRSPINVFFLNLIGSRALAMEKRLESLVFKDSRTRIIEFLLDLATRKGQQVGFETVVRRFMTHQEIANLTATSRQTVTTILNELRADNIITFDRRRLLIRDMEKLRKAKIA